MTRVVPLNARCSEVVHHSRGTRYNYIRKDGTPFTVVDGSSVPTPAKRSRRRPAFQRPEFTAPWTPEGRVNELR